MEIMRTENLTKKYKVYDSETIALDKVSFSVEKGEFVAITGTSGSGKSALLHLIGGVDKPTEGKVIVDGQDIYSLPAKDLSAFRRRKVAIVYQFFNLLPMLNVRSNISLPLELDGREFYYPNQLSGGQQQRVAIARALITSPALLLADEPTGNLDSKNSREITELLRKSNRELGQTVIMVTHDLHIANQTDRIIEMSDGKIISDMLI